MANSLRAKLSKLRHDRHITEEEYQEFIKKLDGHDKQIRADAIKDFAEWLPTKFDLRFANDCPKVWVDEYFNHTSEKILEKLKEQKE